MKLEARRVDGFLAAPGDCRLVLLHGEDGGLVRERASALVRRVAGSLDDPFRVAELERDGLARLVAECAAPPMTGGRRVVRVRDVTDGATPAVQSLLASRAEGLAVFEAGELTGRSKLKALVENAADAVAIGCYAAQGAELRRGIVADLDGHDLTADADALEMLCALLGEDRGTTRQEIAKLALYVLPDHAVTLDHVMAAVGDVAGLELDDAVFAALGGEVALADRALGLALAEGAAPVTVVRAVLSQLQRLERIRIGVDGGQPATAVIRGLRPPVFGDRQHKLVSALARWTEAGLTAAASAAFEAEKACKRTGTPAVTLCRQLVLNVARRAAARPR